MFLNYSNKTSFQITLHVLIWVLLLLLPYLLSHNDSIDFFRHLKQTWVPMFFYAIIFYLNYFFLIEKNLFKRELFSFVSVNLLVIIVFTWILFEVKDYLTIVYDIKPVSGLKRPPARLYIYKDAITMIIPIIISFAVKTAEKWSRDETEKKESEKEILKSELQHLKYQLQPHFFFNSLNTIYSLVERSPKIAQETIHNLSKLMRYLLYDTDLGQAQLSDEIEFMRQYINLMKLRISDKTTVRVDFPKLSKRYNITPLLFISLIENAFKHGVSSTVASEIVFALSVDKNLIRFVSQNKNFPKNEDDKSGSGIGLSNLQKQLTISYPGKHNFKTSIDHDLFTVLLEISTD